MRLTLLTLLILGGCTRKAAPWSAPPAGGGTVGGDTSRPVDTSGPQTDTAMTDTAPQPREPVRWYTTLKGGLAADGEVPIDEFIGLHLNLVGDVYGDGHENLATNGAGRTLIFRGLPGPGELTAEEAHKITGGVPLFYGLPAGDVNADGYADVWHQNRLFLGPIEGEVDFEADWYAEIDTSRDRYQGGFDADGDGHVDAVEFDDDHQAFIHYGPFEQGSVRQPWESNPDAVSRIRTDCGTGSDHENVWVRPDLFGPGRTALAMLNEESTSYPCLYAVEIFDISGPRGQDQSSADKITFHAWGETWPGGDHDGDGVEDLFMVGGLTQFGPFSSHIPLDDDQDPKQTFTPRAFVHRPLADMNGDGRPELLLELDAPHDEVADWYVLPSTTLGEDIPVTELGVPLELPVEAWLHPPIASGDLDGDGKAEFIMGAASGEPGGRIYIWRGLDIFPD